jgi:PadR family transcriptional regulator PadR
MRSRAAGDRGAVSRRLSAASDEEVLASLPKNFMRPCLLLLIGEQASHGYDLLLRLDQLGIRRTDPGGLYRTLRAMEREGLVASSWDISESGPPRRTYRLTEDSEDWLHAWAAMLSETSRVVEGFLKRYGALAGAASRARA